MLFPCDHQRVLSVNHSINSDNFPTTWGTFDTTSSLILSLPAGCIAAYCLTPIWPDQQHHLCVAWNGLIYVNHTVMFSLASSTGVFSCMVYMLVMIYKAAGFFPLLK